MIGTVYDVTIRDDSIRLGQFLKLANLIESGAEAKEVIADGLVTVNGEVETRRGRQLAIGDVIEIGGMGAGWPGTSDHCGLVTAGGIRNLRRGAGARPA